MWVFDAENTVFQKTIPHVKIASTLQHQILPNKPLGVGSNLHEKVMKRRRALVSTHSTFSEASRDQSLQGLD